LQLYRHLIYTTGLLQSSIKNIELVLLFLQLINRTNAPNGHIFFNVCLTAFYRTEDVFK